MGSKGVGLGAFKAGPAVVRARAAAVDLLPRVVAHVAHPDLAGDGMQRKAEGVAHAHVPDLGGVAVGVAVKEGIAGIARARAGIDAQNFPRQRVDLLRAQRAGAVVDAVAVGHVERAVGPKLHKVERVRRALQRQAVVDVGATLGFAGEGSPVGPRGVADVLEGAVLAQDHHAGIRLVDARIARAGVDAQHARDARPLVRKALGLQRLVGVAEVEPGRARKIGVQRHGHQPAVRRLVDLVGEVDKVIGQQPAVLHHAHRARLLRHKDAPVRRDVKARRPVQPADDALLHKAGRQEHRHRVALGLGGRGRRGEGREEGEEEDQSNDGISSVGCVHLDESFW